MHKTKFSRTLLVAALALAIVLSVTGGTIAWFTDEVTSANNVIASGTLDVELEYSTDMNTWNKLEKQTNIFDEDALWEPGYTEVVYLRVSNEGSLALKYQLGVNIVSEISGVNKAGEQFQLSDYIYFGAVETDTAYEGRPAARAAITDSKKISEGVPTEGNLIAGAAADTLALVVYMPETVGNEANHQAGSQPSITLGLSVLATQDTVEKDAFDDQYDVGAPAWTGNIDIDWYLANPSAAQFEISTAEELAGLAAIVNGTAEGVAKDSFSGQTIKLTANIDLGNQNWTPIGAYEKDNSRPFSGTFDGQGNTVHNLYIKIEDNRDSVGFFGYAANAKIKGLTIENADINADYFVGTIVGKIQVGNISDCHVKGDISVVARSNYAAGIVGDGYYSMEGCSVIAEGVGKITSKAVAGGLCGRISEGSHSIKNCIVKNLDIQSGQQIAAITGFLHYGNTVSGCAVENVSLTLTATKPMKPAIGLASGLWYYKEDAVITISDNTFKNVTISATADVTGTTDILCGWEWNDHLTGFVENNNIRENITNNLVYQ